MKKRTVWFAMLLLTLAQLLAANTSRASEDDQQAVKAAAAQFYAALNSMFTGDADPMNKIWSHADDVTYMDPSGGFRVVWDKVLASWKAQADMKLGGKVTPKDMQIVVGHDIAVTHNYEIGENFEDGKRKKVSIRATNVFRKEDGKWKMIGHHTDKLPFLEK